MMGLRLAESCRFAGTSNVMQGWLALEFDLIHDLFGERDRGIQVQFACC
jgi:hypothetical protein